MEKCSELVMRLHGSEATEGMFDLVFGRNLGMPLVNPVNTWKTQKSSVQSSFPFLPKGTTVGLIPRCPQRYLKDRS